MISTTTIYALVVFSLPAKVGDEPIFIDIRPMTFAECRHRRQNELTFYEMLRNQKVAVLCHKEE